MLTRLAALVMLAVTGGAAATAAAEPCMELGFKDQWGRTEYSPARVVAFDDQRVELSYERLHGRVVLTVQERSAERTLTLGEWHQDDGWGKAYLRWERDRKRAVGYWTNGDGERRYDLFLRTCR